MSGSTSTKDIERWKAETLQLRELRKSDYAKMKEKIDANQRECRGVLENMAEQLRKLRREIRCHVYTQIDVDDCTCAACRVMRETAFYAMESK